MSTAQTKHELSGDRSAHDDGPGLVFLDVNVPIGETGGVKIGYFGDSDVWTEIVVLADEGAFVGFVYVV